MCARCREFGADHRARGSESRKAEATEAAKHLRDFAENFALLRQLARAAVKSNEKALAVLRQIRAAAALM
jgi:hypothetical protein